MTSHRWLTLFAFGSFSCFSPDLQTGNGDPSTPTDSSGAGEAGSAETVAGSDSGGENGCVEDGDCIDDNPCSEDRCESGACVHPPITDDPSCVCSGPGD